MQKPKHTHTQTQILRGVITQSMTFIKEHHVCPVNVEQLVWIHRHKDAAYVGLSGRQR